MAGHALLGVADAAGSIELLRLVGFEVSDWGQVLWGRRNSRGAVLMRTFFWAGFRAGVSLIVECPEAACAPL